MRPFEFDETWHFDAAPEDVYAAIRDATRWSNWWPAVAVTTDDEVTYRCVIRSPFWYAVTIDLTVTSDDPPRTIEVDVEGDLVGSARGDIRGADDGRTAARYRATVRPIGPALGMAATLARPILRWNHDAIMRRAARRLEQHLADGG